MRRALAFLGLLLGSACGYHTGIVLPEGQGSVAITLFHNDSKLRDLEAPLNAALAQSVERLLDTRLTAPERADLVVRGRILSYEKRGGIRSKENQLLETGVIISVEAELVRGLAPAPAAPPPANPLANPPANIGTKEAPPSNVIARTRTSAQAGFRLDEPDGERIARERVLRNLADRIVMDLFSPVASGSTP